MITFVRVSEPLIPIIGAFVVGAFLGAIGHAFIRRD